jgi:2-C-methyl-D-erythritol 2,4-cyclodiphosphate synthase
MRVGLGWDLHRLEPGRPLWLGGLRIESPVGEVAYSDGDVLLHALIDAILGSAALGDIGTHFPPGEPQWEDAASSELLLRCLELFHESDYSLINMDATIILERPKLGPHIPAIRSRLAELLVIPYQAISVKAKSKEQVDAVGRGEAIEAHCIVLAEKLHPSVWV